jgi:hypothetical protein
MVVAKKAPVALVMLWRDGYFVERRTRADVENELSRRKYNFPPNALRMALHRADFLTESGSYGKTYIQKYPYEKEGDKDE